MARRNDHERREWVQNDEGLYNWWKRSGLGLYRFVRENRAEIDAVIDPVLDGSKPAHHLAYPQR